jgi:hypothetical protein
MIASALQSLIRYYKRTFSPALLSTCRFTPTCSDYALEAIERHGAIAGAALAVWRVIRCNPFTQGGLDLVPTKLSREEIRIHTCHVGDGKNSACLK